MMIVAITSAKTSPKLARSTASTTSSVVSWTFFSTMPNKGSSSFLSIFLFHSSTALFSFSKTSIWMALTGSSSIKTVSFDMVDNSGASVVVKRVVTAAAVEATDVVASDVVVALVVVVVSVVSKTGTKTVVSSSSLERNSLNSTVVVGISKVVSSTVIVGTV